jgi:hypothetical protein
MRSLSLSFIIFPAEAESYELKTDQADPAT